MVLEKPKSEEEAKCEEKCIHIHVVICDTGYLFSEERRDVGLRCKGCGLEWDVQLKSGNRGASIKLRVTGSD